jgi:hypothetical protein
LTKWNQAGIKMPPLVIILPLIEQEKEKGPSPSNGMGLI